MAAPGGNPLLSSGLLSPQSPQRSADQHFAIYSTTSSCLVQQLEKQEAGPCDSFCQTLHHPFLADFPDVQGLHECGDPQRFQELGGHLVGSNPIAGGNGIEDRLSARRVHKADREKLRRDKLNEQFSELASALDPDRPKNDKATILGESVQVVKDLREEVKRLKTEHTSLLNESRDLTQEKNELREEKATLKVETEQLQNQLQQRMRTMSPWMALDPSMVMGAAAFPYPVAVPQPVSVPQSDSHQAGPPRAIVAPTPYMPLAPPLGAFHMHPSLQAYAMFGNRHGDGSNPYLPYPSFPQPVNSHSHIERPYAQYPSPVQSVPGYVVQIPPSQSQSQPSPPSSEAPVYRPCVAGIPVVSAQNHGSNQRSKEGNHCSPAAQGGSQHGQTESGQEAQDQSASHCHVEASGSPGIQDITSESQSPETREVNLELHLEKGPVSNSIVSPTFSTEEKFNFLADQSRLSLDSEGSRFAGKELAHFRSGLESECDQENDPTLRPPAA